MRVRTTSATTLTELMRKLGAPDSARAQIEKQNGVSENLPSGTALTLDPKMLPSDWLERSGDVVTRADLGHPLGALGLFGAQKNFDTKVRDASLNNLGALQALSALSIPQLIDKASLDVTVPLRAGRTTLPLPDGQELVLDVPPGTVLRLSTKLRGENVTSTDISFSKPIELVNATELALGNGIVNAFAHGAVKVKLEGVAVDGDGRVTPRGKIERPSMNLLKHVFSDGRSSTNLDYFSALGPQLKTRVTDLVRGDLVARDAAVGPRTQNKHFDVLALTSDLGGMLEKGTFSLSLEGRAGFIDVGAGSIAVRGKDAPITAKITGSFSIEGSEVSVDAEARVHTPFGSAQASGSVTADLQNGSLSIDGKASVTPRLPVHIALDDDATGASVGPLSVTAKGDGVELGLHGALLSMVRSMGDRFHVDLANGIDANFDGAIHFEGGARLSRTPEGMVLESDGVKASITPAGTKISGDAFDLVVGEGSTIAFEATGVRLEGDRLVVENANAGFAIEVGGVAQKGMLAAKLSSPAKLEGTFDVAVGEAGAVGGGQARFSVKARPKIAGVPMPAKVGVEAGVQVKLMPGAIAFASTEKMKLSL